MSDRLSRHILFLFPVFISVCPTYFWFFIPTAYVYSHFFLLLIHLIFLFCFRWLHTNLIWWMWQLQNQNSFLSLILCLLFLLMFTPPPCFLVYFVLKFWGDVRTLHVEILWGLIWWWIHLEKAIICFWQALREALRLGLLESFSDYAGSEMWDPSLYED